MIPLQFVDLTTFLFIVLNPFLLIIYLMDLVEDLDRKTFRSVLIRAAVISGAVFAVFAVLGEAIFLQLLKTRFGSFQVFGGIIFLLIAIRFAFYGHEALRQTRGKPEHVAGSIAMPMMIGPSSVSASVLLGNQLEWAWALLGIITAVTLSVVIIIALKGLHDWVRPQNELLVQRYIAVSGRIMALIMGTFAVEMILQGLTDWLNSL